MNTIDKYARRFFGNKCPYTGTFCIYKDLECIKCEIEKEERNVFQDENKENKMIHDLKILEEFANAVYSGDKNFEIRWNDRGFQKGDKVRFKVINDSGTSIEHDLEQETFVITYVLSGWGIKNGYVVFGILNEIAL